MRVLHLLKSNSYSGAENIAISICRSLQKQSGNANEFYYCCPRGPVETILQQQGIRYLPLQRFSVTEIRKVIKTHKIDLIHAHDFSASVFGAFSCCDCKMVSHLHNNPTWLRKFGLRSVLYLAASPRISKVIGVSSSIFQEYRFYQYLKAKAVVLNNPVDAKEIVRKSQLNDPTEEFDALYVGRLSYPKNPQKFIRIIELASKRFPNLRAAMIGDGNLREECLQQIITKGIGNRMELLGFQENPFPFMKHAKAVIIPSDWEGFGLVAIEAMTFGVPVLASPVGGLKEIVTSECGLLAEHEQVLADELIRLLNDPEYYRKKSSAAKRIASRYDNIEDYGDAINKIYQELS